MPESVRAVVERGLVYVEREGLRWKAERGCASCHHVPMMIWTMNEARARGLDVNDAALAEVTDWVLAEDNAAKARDTAGLAAIITILAIPVEKAGPYAGTGGAASFAEYVLEKQQADGSWAAPEGRPPILASGESATLLARVGLGAPWVGESAPVERLAPALDRATEWLSERPASDNFQVRNLRLLRAAHAGAATSELVPLIDAIVERQNADGGWSQTPDLASDAYATGQALYVLAWARCGHRHPTVARGIASLLETQREDGTWAMLSRPIEPGSGGSKLLDPITYAGTAWALLGLLRATSVP
jgi:hypothetical protein